MKRKKSQRAEDHQKSHLPNKHKRKKTKKKKKKKKKKKTESAPPCAPVCTECKTNDVWCDSCGKWKCKLCADAGVRFGEDKLGKENAIFWCRACIPSEQKPKVPDVGELPINAYGNIDFRTLKDDDNIVYLDARAPELNESGIPFAPAMHGFSPGGGVYWPEIRGKGIFKQHRESLKEFRRWKQHKKRLLQMHLIIKQRLSRIRFNAKVAKWKTRKPYRTKQALAWDDGLMPVGWTRSKKQLPALSPDAWRHVSTFVDVFDIAALNAVNKDMQNITNSYLLWVQKARLTFVIGHACQTHVSLLVNANAERLRPSKLDTPLDAKKAFMDLYFGKHKCENCRLIDSHAAGEDSNSQTLFDTELCARSASWAFRSIREKRAAFESMARRLCVDTNDYSLHTDKIHFYRCQMTPFQFFHRID